MSETTKKKFLLTAPFEDNITVYLENTPYILPKNSTFNDLTAVNPNIDAYLTSIASSRMISTGSVKTEDSEAKFLFIDRPDFYLFSPCNYTDEFHNANTTLLNNERIFVTQPNITAVNDYVYSEYLKFINNSPQEIIDETLVYCKYNDGGNYIYYLPKGTTEIQDTFFVILKTLSDNTGDRYMIAVLYAAYFKVMDASIGWTIQNVENVKIPYTLAELSQMMNEEKVNFAPVLYRNYSENNYTGTFEFSDGTKKTLSELTELFS